MKPRLQFVMVLLGSVLVPVAASATTVHRDGGGGWNNQAKQASSSHLPSDFASFPLLGVQALEIDSFGFAPKANATEKESTELARSLSWYQYYRLRLLLKSKSWSHKRRDDDDDGGAGSDDDDDDGTPDDPDDDDGGGDDDEGDDEGGGGDDD